MSQELKRALIMGDYDRAEKLLREARQTGEISPFLAAQIETYIAMARWETDPNRNMSAQLRAIIAKL